MHTQVEFVRLSAFRAAWRDLKRDVRVRYGPTGFAAPRLERSPCGRAVVVKAEAYA